MGIPSLRAWSRKSNRMNSEGVCALGKKKMGKEKSVALTLSEIAVVYETQGQYEKALEIYEKNLKVFKKYNEN